MPQTPDHKNAPRAVLSVESLAFGGDGVARYPEGHDQAGKVVFVRGGLPGEDVSVRVSEQRKDFDRARVTEVLRPSPDRVRPPCPLFGTCGGCQFQHLNYAAQIRIKGDWIAGLAVRAGVDPDLVRPVAPSPQEYGYRFRARLKVDAQGRTGFNRAGSNRVAPLESCPIMSPELNRLAGRLSQFMSGHAPGVPFELEAGALGPNRFVLVRPLNLRKKPRDYDRRLRHLVQNLRDGFAGEGAGVYFNRPPGDQGPPQGSLALPLEGLDLTLFPGVFAQAQAAQNKALVRTVTELAGVSPGTGVLDLMAGMGNFSLPLARAGARVLAVELDPLACLNGQYNAAQAGLEMEFRNRSAQAALEELCCSQEKQWEMVVADPPRSGIKGLTLLLAGAAPKRLVYISCNPPALARDLGELIRKGYQVKEMAPLDLFPQTFHLETVCLLVKT